MIRHGKQGQKNELPPFDIQVDGGINEENVRQCVEAGANVIVAGTSLYQSSDMSIAIKKMRTIAESVSAN